MGAKTAGRICDRNEIAEGGCHRSIDPVEGSGFFLIEALRAASGQQGEFAERGKYARAREGSNECVPTQRLFAKSGG